MIEALSFGAALAGATVDVTSYTLLLDRRRLEVALQAHWTRARPSCLGFAPSPLARDDRHPLVVELWQIREGRMQPAGLDQDAWYRLSGGFWGAWAAAALRAMTGPVKADPLATLLQDGIAGAALGAKHALALSQTTRERYGRYEEVIVMVPDLQMAAVAEPVCLVAAMHTNSVFARTIDRALAYGFGKRAARITCLEHEWRVASADDAGLHLQTRSSTLVELLPAQCRSTPHYWRQPLLGQLASGRLVLSRLARTHERVAEGLSGELWIGPDCCALLESATHVVSAFGHDGFGTLLRDVRFELYPPERVS